MTTAFVAKELRRALLALDDVSTVHGPGLFSADVYFLRIVMTDSSSFSVELRAEKGGDAK